VQTLECPKRAALTTKAAFFLQAPQGSYIAFKYGGGAYNYNLSIDDVVVSVLPSCIPTGTPRCVELSAHTAKLSWDLVDATQTAWEVEYSTSIEFAGSLTVDATTHEDFELTGLVAETQYYARVRAKCGNDDPSAWSETITITTFNTCPMPFNLAANNLTAGKADLSWTGSIDVSSYDVRHRKAYHVIGDYERFDTRPDGWEQKFQELDRVLNGEGWEEGEAYGRIPWMFGTQNGVFDSHAYLYDFGHSHQWLITDSYTVKSSDAFNFDLALTGYNEFNTTDFLEPEITETNYRFIVLIIKDSDYNPGPTACKEWEILREWNNTGSKYVFNDIAYSRLGEHVSIDLSEYVGQTVRIAFYGESSQYTDGNTLHIDNMAFGTPVAATPWETKQGITANTATVTEVLRNLSAETEYEAQVKSNCSNPEAWCAPLFFKTLEAPDAPTGLQVVEGSITATSASFSWNGEANESFQYFTVTNPQEGFEPTEATVWTNVQGNTVNVTDAFTPNRVARFYLRKDCGDDGLSKYTYVEFRTGCGTMVIDDNNSYTENFDSYTAGTSDAQAPSTYPNDPLPQCWQFLNRSNDNRYPQVFISTFQDYIVSGNCLFFKSSYSTSLYAILPEFAQPVANLQVTFTYRNEGTDSNNGTLHVGYMIDPSDASTFVSTLECRKTTELTTMTAYFTHAPQQGRMAFMYKGGGGEPYYLSIDDVVVSEAPTCFPTGKPTHGELSAHTTKLSWDLVDPTQTAWEVQYSKTSDFSEATVVTATTHEDFQITGLDAETQYHVRVRAKCSETDFSAWSETLTFTTLRTCPVPTNLAASNLTQESAKINWTGSIDVASYAVRYQRTQQVVGIDERFNTASLPEGWESKKGLLSDIMAGGAFGPSDQRSWIFGANGYGVDEMSAYLVVNGTDHNDWLITKRHTVTSSDAFSFYLSISSTNPNSSQITNGPDDRFVVLITADDGRTWSILREWNNSGSEFVYSNISSYTFHQESINLSGYVGQTVRIAFYGESTVSNASNCLHLDNVTFGSPMAASEPQTQTGITGNQETAANSFVIQGLVANTEYEVQVKSECSDPEVWSAPITFRTLDPYMKVFVGGDISGADEWNKPNNWVPAGVPTINQGVELQANATIPSGYVAEANQIEGDYGLTIEDGGQLRTNNEVEATVQKNITGYGRGGSHWYLIASPVKETLTPDGDSVTNIVTTESAYDLYSFDGSQQGAEWRNYKQHEQTFRFRNGLGYLVANSVGVTQSFKGTVLPNNQTKTVELDFAETTFGAWNLVGNPYTCVAYLSDNHSFYRLEETTEGSRIVLAEDNAIAPKEGVFVEAADGDDAVTFTTTAPTAAASALNFSLHKVEQTRGGVSTGSTALDRIRISIGEDRNLGHLDLMADANRLYIPLGDKDMAVVSVQPVGELPLNFEAAEDGTYTLSFENATEGLVYCHLIDNLTGADVDLLRPNAVIAGEDPQSPAASYTFTAKKSDYASRFKVVFASVCGDANGDNETFAFNNNGNWIIANEGRATLQVIDLMGRILSSEQIEGSVQTQINQPAGLYLIRLVNGDNVKVQKVVVR